MIRWVEISADYRCNCRCIGCFSSDAQGDVMTTPEILQSLEDGRRAGADKLWVGGGEPTLRKDLFAIVAGARRFGYTTIKLQTNGMMLAYPDFTRRLVRAGVTEVNFSIKGAVSRTHDAHTRTPGSHGLMLRGIAEARPYRLPLAGDILVTSGNLAELVDMIRRYTEEGLQGYNVWMLSAFDRATPGVRALVPRVRDVVAAVVAVMDAGIGTDPGFIKSLHTPPCTVPAGYHACLFNAADLDLLVVNPGGRSFRLEESPIEGGVYLERCDSCSMRARCGGLRRDYLDIHGDEEFWPPGVPRNRPQRKST